MYVSVMHECCRGGKPKIASDFGWNIFVAINQLPSLNCFSDEQINIPLLDVTVATGSAQKILMHELCMLCSFFSLRAKWQRL